MATIQRANKRLELFTITTRKAYNVVRREAVYPKENRILNSQPISLIWRQYFPS